MKGLMQHVLGDDWHLLPPALQQHYCGGRAVDRGQLDIQFPRWMTPLLFVLHGLGALVYRRGDKVATVVAKEMAGDRQHWRRHLHYADGRQLHFHSTWTATDNGELIEYVNPLLGLRMKPTVRGDELHYYGVCFVVKLGTVLIRVPEAWLLGHTTIVERAIDERHFAMDFRLTHPWFGEVFRYSGQFEALGASD